MTHTYEIKGMTCGSCIAKVRQALLSINGITAADIQLSSPQATITMRQHVPAAELQRAVATAGHYSIKEANVVMEAAATEEKPSYYPLILIFAYIAGTTLLLQLFGGDFNGMQWMTHFMAGFFLVFSFFKLMNLRGFAAGYGTYDVVARKIPAYGFIYPFIELALGLALLLQVAPLLTNGMIFLVMFVSSIGVVQTLLKKSVFQCACLGTIIKLPLSKVTLFEDLLMLSMSAITVCYLLLS
jgi:copper chaperone CopZ